MDGVLADRAWVTGPLGASDALPLDEPIAPLVAVRRVDGGWEIALISRDALVRARWRDWLRLLPSMHCAYERDIGAYRVSDFGMCQLTRGRHPFGLLLGDARRAIVGNTGMGR